MEEKEGLIEYRSFDTVSRTGESVTIQVDGRRFKCGNDYLYFNCATFKRNVIICGYSDILNGEFVESKENREEVVTYQSKYYRYPESLEKMIVKVLKAGVLESAKMGWIGAVPMMIFPQDSFWGKSTHRVWVLREGNSFQERQHGPGGQVWHPWMLKRRSERNMEMAKALHEKQENISSGSQKIRY